MLNEKRILNMSKITTNRINRTTSISSQNRNTPINPIKYNFNDRLEFSEQILDTTVATDDSTSHKLIDMLFRLLFEILCSGCSIIRRGAIKTNHNSQIEASFQPPRSSGHKARIYLPLSGMQASQIDAATNYLSYTQQQVREQLILALQQVAASCDNRTLLKLLILTCHEYGHFISYLQGFHDQQLKTGLSIMWGNFTKLQEKCSYAVFNEEVTAWRLAENKLRSYKFSYWPLFNQVKINSLKVYYQQLQLANAGIDTYCKLSLLGIDLKQLQSLS